MPIINDELLTGTSLNTLIHFSQEYLAGRFQHFDYGSEENTKRYGQEAAPEYDLTKVTAKVHLLWGMNDYLADDADVQFLIKYLPNVRSRYPVPLKQFNHLDFLWAKDKMSLVYHPVLKMLSGYSITAEKEEASSIEL
ncbi:hypothetical protein Avbf_08469 [Armadillidium vulgare]|nr:hypothetical protein Avbf_08469 [Armadillidium vulgare]